MRRVTPRPRNEMVRSLNSGPRTFLCGVCMFYLSEGFLLGGPVSSHHPMTCSRLLGDSTFPVGTV